MADTDNKYLEDKIDEVSRSVAIGDSSVRDYAATVSASVDDLRTDLGSEVLSRAAGDVRGIEHTDETAAVNRDSITQLRSEMGSNTLDLKENINQNTLGLLDTNTLIATLREELLNSLMTMDLDHRLELQLFDDRIKKYEQMLSDITVDNYQIHVNDGNVIAGAWTILSQARTWDLEIISKLGKVNQDLTDKIDKDKEDILNQIPDTEDIISDILEDLSNAPVIKDLDEQLNKLELESIANAEAIIAESTERQKELAAQAQATADRIKEESDARKEAVLAEQEERFNEITRQADITQKEIDAETKKLRDDLQAQIDAIDTELNVDLTDLYNRVDKADQAIVDAKAAAKADNVALGKRADALKQDIDAEEQARIADILLLNDGLTKEINNRVDGDKKSIAAIENYKSSNDKALANVRTEISTLVTEQTAQAKRVDALDVRLKANETETGKAMAAAASAVTKAEAAVTATEAMASEITSVKASLESTDKKVAANTSAISGLSTKVSNVEGKLSTAISDITALEADMVLADKGIKANSKAIEELRVTQEQHGKDITLTNQKITSLSSDLDLVEKDLTTKVSSTAFESLKTTVTKQGENITTLTNRTTLLESGLETVKGDLSKKANSSALEGLSTKVTNIDGRVTANASKILGLESGLKDTNSKVDKKLDASVIQQYSTTVQTNKAIADSITAYDTSLLIGSTNLLFGTGIREGFNSYNSRLTWRKVKDDPTDTVRIDYTNNPAMGIATAMPYRRMKLIKGRKYIVSFLGHGTIANLNYMYIMRPEGGNVHIGTMKLGSDGNAQRTLEFTWNEDTASNFGILIATRAGVAGTWFTVRSLMIEEGTKATTTWKPNAIEQAEYMDATAKAVQQVTASVEEVEKGVAANASAITALNTKVTKVEGDLKNTATAESVQQLKNQVTAIDGRVTSNSSAITKLTNDLSSTNTELSKKASTAALNALKSDVTAIDGKVTANTTSITDLKSTVEQQGKDLKTKASAAALTALTSTVTAQGKDIESISNSMTDLSNQVTIIDNERKIMDTRSKVEQPAYYWKTYPKRVVYEYKTASSLGLTGMGTLVVLRTETPWNDPSGGAILQTVYSEDGTLDANRASRGTGNAYTWTAFTQPMKSALEKIEANSKATESLSSKVTANEKAITAASSKLTKLESDISVVKGDLEKKADASALTTLQTKVTNIDGKLTTTSGLVTQLSGKVTTLEGEVSKKLDATVILDYYTKVETDEVVAGSIQTYDANLILGGTNILWGTARSSGFIADINGTKWGIGSRNNSGSAHGGAGVFSVSSGKTEGKLLIATAPEFRKTSTNRTEDKVYVLSLGLSCAGDTPVIITAIGMVNALSNRPLNKFKPLELTKSHTRYSYVLENIEIYNRSDYGIYIEVANMPKAHSVYFSGVMLEVGNKASGAWTPNAIETAKDIKANASAITSIKVEVTNLDGKVTSLAASNTTLITSLEEVTREVSNKNKTYYQQATPVDGPNTKLVKGDGWVNTQEGTNNKLSIWDGSQWVDASDPRVAELQEEVSNKADSSAFNDLRSEVSKQGEDIAAVASAQTALEGKVTKVQGDLSKKAEATVVDELINRVEITEEGISTLTQANTVVKGEIEIIEKGLETKLDATALDGIYTKIETNKIVSGSISEFKSSMKITGSNLLYATGIKGSLVRLNTAPNKVDVFDKPLKSTFGYTTPFYRVTALSDSTLDIGIITDKSHRKTNLVKGNTYTLSWKGQGTVTTLDRIAIIGLAANQVILFPAHTMGNVAGSGNNAITFTSAIDVDECGIRIGTSKYKKEQWFTVANVTLNEGEYFTEWSANASEVQDNIDANASAITNIQANVKDINGELDAISSSITSLEATNQALNKDNLLKPVAGISKVGTDYLRGSIPLTAPIILKTGDVYTIRAKLTVRHSGSLSSAQGFRFYLDGVSVFNPANIQKAEDEIFEFTFIVGTNENGLKRTHLLFYFWPSGTALPDTLTTVHWAEMYKGATPVSDLASAKSVTSLEARVTTSEGKITSLTNSTTSLENRIDDPKTGLTAIANNVTTQSNRIDKTEKDIKTLSDSITRVDARITDAEKGITANANATSALSGRVTKTEQGLEALSTSVDDVRAEIGAEYNNLLDGTSVLEGWTVYRAVTASTITLHTDPKVKSGIVRVTKAVAGTTAVVGVMTAPKYRNVSVKNGDRVTVSYLTRGTRQPNYTYLMGWSETGNKQFQANYAGFNSKDFIRVSHTDVANRDISNVYLLLAVNGTFEKDEWVEFAEVKIEVGTKVTPWTPSARERVYANASTVLETRVTEVNGVVTELSASYVMKADVNGLVTSAGLYNDGNQSAFGVNADFFYVGKGSQRKKMFLVTTSTQTIGGVSYPAGVWMDVAAIANATIGTAKIANLAITNAKIANATITDAKIANLNAGKITAGTLNANRIGAKTITAAKLSVDNIRAISANLGKFESTVSGKGTTVISGPLIEVKDDSGKVRVRLGVW